jgi:hypothetical protein
VFCVVAIVGHAEFARAGVGAAAEEAGVADGVLGGGEGASGDENIVWFNTKNSQSAKLTQILNHPDQGLPWFRNAMLVGQLPDRGTE